MQTLRTSSAKRPPNNTRRHPERLWLSHVIASIDVPQGALWQECQVAQRARINSLILATLTPLLLAGLITALARAQLFLALLALILLILSFMGASAQSKEPYRCELPIIDSDHAWTRYAITAPCLSLSGNDPAA